MLSPDFTDLTAAEFGNWDQSPAPEMDLDTIEELVNFDCTTTTDMADFFTNLTGDTDTTSSQNQDPRQVFPAQAAGESEAGHNSGPSSEAVSFGAYDETAAQLFGEESTDEGLQQVASEEQISTSLQCSSSPPGDSVTRPQAGLVPAPGLEWPLPDPTLDPTSTIRQGSVQGVSVSLSTDMAQLGLTLNSSTDLEDFPSAAPIPVESTGPGLGLGIFTPHDQTVTEELPIGPSLFDPMELLLTESQQPANRSSMVTPALAPFTQQDNSAATMDTALGWGQGNQVADPISSAPGWGLVDNQVSMPMGFVGGWGQDSNQVVMPTSSATSMLGWGQNINQVVIPTSSVLGWGPNNGGQAAMPTNPAPALGQLRTVSSERHAYVPTETLTHNQGKPIIGNPAISRGSEAYLTLGERPEAWGPPQTPRLFSYTKRGEWSPRHIFDASDLIWHITNAKRLANRPLKIWIQSAPSQFNARYPNKDSTKCRWAGCPSYRNAIIKGFFRVAFDERPDQSGILTNPFHNAGYMHLHCFEKIFDLFELIHCGIAAIEDRVFLHENGNEMAVGPHNAQLMQAYMKWCSMHAAAYSLFVNSRDKTTKRGRHIPNEQRLWSVLTRVMVQVETKMRGGLWNAHHGKAVPSHLGDLDEYMRRYRLRTAIGQPSKNTKRGATEMDAELSTTDANGPGAKRACRDGATEAPSPALSHITVRDDSEEGKGEEEEEEQ